MNNGFIKVASAIPNVKIADCQFNTAHIENLINQANEQDVQIVCFPELSISAFSCADLFKNNFLINQSQSSLLDIVDSTKNLNIISIVGLPIRINNNLFNCAAVIYSGNIVSIHPKSILSSDELRFFSPANSSSQDHIIINNKKIPFGNDIIINCNNIKFSIEFGSELSSPIPPSTFASQNGSHIVFSLGAAFETSKQDAIIENYINTHSRKCNSAYVLSSAGFGESSTDLSFAGKGIISECGITLKRNTQFDCNENLIISDIDIDIINAEQIANNTTLLESKSFRNINCNWNQSEYIYFDRIINPSPFLPSELEMIPYCKEIIEIQTIALVTRIKHVNANKLVIGVSGGLDSTLTLIIATEACDKLGIDRNNIIAITMPGFGTSDRTYFNAVNLIKHLGCTFKEISIKEACIQHFKDIDHDINIRNVAYENAQARERTQILMDLANNCNGLVVGTGDLSELALGWATFNGDHMSMYAVNGGVPKTLVKCLVKYKSIVEQNIEVQKILADIVDTPVSPELLPTNEEGTIAQKTEDLVGPYELHDFFLFYTLKYGLAPSKILFLAKSAFSNQYSDDTIAHWYKTFIRRFFNQQFKRNCMPDGPKVLDISLSPRGDWKMPSDASSRIWLDEII